MNHSDATFELIKELTQNEKRHFRVFSGTTGSDKNYLKVFDALDKMKTYDGKALNKKLAGTKINVSYEKNYLHKQLQKSLRTFYSENNSSIQLLDILKTIEILYRKRLIAQCQKMVDRGIGIVEKYELWDFHLELIEWQYRIYARSGNYKKLGSYEKEGLREKKKLLDTIGTYAAVQREIYSMIVIANDQGIYIRKKLKDECRKAITRCLPLLKKHESGFRIPELVYSTLYLAAHFSGDLKKAYHYSLITYSLYNNYPHFKNDLPFKFFVTIGNLINRCVHLKKYEEGLRYISELKLFVKHLPAFAAQDMQQEHHSAIFGYEARILLSTQHYADALKAAREFERTYSRKNLRRNIQLADHVKLARVYFANGLLRESLKRINELINEKSTEISLEFPIHAHLMRLCIHYDLHNYSVLEHLSQTAKRFLEKNEATDEFAFTFIELIRQVSKTDVQKKHREIFSRYLPILKKQFKEPFEQNSDLILWIEGKLK